MLYVGVDLHRKASQVAVVDEQGKLIFNRHMPSHREDLLRVFWQGWSQRINAVAYEATYGWGWFADLLDDVGIAAHMAHPRANKAIASARVKNDAVDAKTLAQLLRTGLLDQNQSLALTRLGGREYHFNVKTASWSGANLDLCVVSISDGADDR